MIVDKDTLLYTVRGLILASKLEKDDILITPYGNTKIKNIKQVNADITSLETSYGWISCEHSQKIKLDDEEKRINECTLDESLELYLPAVDPDKYISEDLAWLLGYYYNNGVYLNDNCIIALSKSMMANNKLFLVLNACNINYNHVNNKVYIKKDLTALINTMYELSRKSKLCFLAGMLDSSNIIYWSCASLVSSLGVPYNVSGLYLTLSDVKEVNKYTIKYPDEQEHLRDTYIINKTVKTDCECFEIISENNTALINYGYLLID